MPNFVIKSWLLITVDPDHQAVIKYIFNRDLLENSREN